MSNARQKFQRSLANLLRMEFKVQIFKNHSILPPRGFDKLDPNNSTSHLDQKNETSANFMDVLIPKLELKSAPKPEPIRENKLNFPQTQEAQKSTPSIHTKEPQKFDSTATVSPKQEKVNQDKNHLEKVPSPEEETKTPEALKTTPIEDEDSIHKSESSSIDPESTEEFVPPDLQSWQKLWNSFFENNPKEGLEKLEDLLSEGTLEGFSQKLEEILNSLNAQPGLENTELFGLLQDPKILEQMKSTLFNFMQYISQNSKWNQNISNSQSNQWMLPEKEASDLKWKDDSTDSQHTHELLEEMVSAPDEESKEFLNIQEKLEAEPSILEELENKDIEVPHQQIETSSTEKPLPTNNLLDKNLNTEKNTSSLENNLLREVLNFSSGEGKSSSDFSNDVSLDKNLKFAKSHTSQVMPQVLKGFVQSFQDGGKSLLVHLNPAHLGKVQIAIDMHGQMVTGKIVVENEAVRNLLESQLNQLRQSLTNQNIQIDALEVSVDSQQGMAKRSHDWQHENKFGVRSIRTFQASSLEGVFEPEPDTGRRYGYNTLEWVA